MSASVEPDPSLTASAANPVASAQEPGVFWALPSDFDLPAGSNLDITA